MRDDIPLSANGERSDVNVRSRDVPNPQGVISRKQAPGDIGSQYAMDGLGVVATRSIRTAFLYNLSYAELAVLEDVSVDVMKAMVRTGLTSLLVSMPG